jgi:hypothetical protein
MAGLVPPVSSPTVVPPLPAVRLVAAIVQPPIAPVVAVICPLKVALVAVRLPDASRLVLVAFHTRFRAVPSAAL